MRDAASKNKPPQKIIAFALLLCFISISFLSVLFLIIHADHDCAGIIEAECHVCVKIYNIKNLLKYFGKTVTSVFFVSLALLIFVFPAGIDEIKIFPATPFKFKVRLNT